MISPKPKQKHITKKNQQQITLGSFNLNGLVGKAPTLSAFIMSTALSTSNTFIIGIQEHKLLPNHSLTSLPCLALPTFSNHAGTKGLMWLISKNLTRAYDIPQLQCNDLIQWIQVHTSSSSILCGNTYWPCTNYDSKAAFNTVSLIISTLDSFIKKYPKVPIYLMGDFNADPFINKGANRANLHRLLEATPSLRIIGRPSPNDHTRPRSGRNIDLIITNPPGLLLLHGQITYHYNSGVVNTFSRKPSDHIPISITQKAQCITIAPSHTVSAWSTIKLSNKNTALIFSNRLDTLLTTFLHERLMFLSSHQPNPAFVTSLWQQLINCINHAAIQTIGMHGYKLPRTKTKTTRPAPDNTESFWSYYNSQKQTTNASDLFTKAELVSHTRSLLAPSTSIHQRPAHIRKEVARVMAIINNTPIPPPNANQTLHLKNRLTALIRKQKSGIGPDKIPVCLLKHASSKLVHAIAATITDCKSIAFYPSQIVDGILTYIHKRHGLATHLLSNFRGIRCTSNPGKLVERAVADPIFRDNSSPISDLCHQQFAGKKKLNAEMLAVILHSIIELRQNKLTLVIFLDISKAFDKVWRELIWSKLYKKGVPPHLIRQLAALYRNLRTAVKSKKGLSEYIEASRGIGQGSPNSTDLFCFLLHDLPQILKSHGIRIDLAGILISALIFLDDIAIPLSNPDSVHKTLRLLETYATNNDITFSLPKC
jgi:hypothetical protein